MKFLSLLVLLFSSPLWSNTDCAHSPNTFACVKYLYNYDGDTITFSIPGVHSYFGKKAKLRVQGIDAPELKPKGRPSPCEIEWGRAAKKLVASELKSAKRIDITDLAGFDKYGRILGQVKYDGKSVKDVLLKNNMAVPYIGKKKVVVNWCELMKKQEKRP